MCFAHSRAERGRLRQTTSSRECASSARSAFCVIGNSIGISYYIKKVPEWTKYSVHSRTVLLTAVPPCFVSGSAAGHTTLWNTIIFPACNVCLTLWNTKDKYYLFDHTLRGPFNRLHTAGSQHSRLSVSASSAVISTSTVSHLFISIRINYTLSASFVNPLIAHKAVLFQKYRQIKILPQGLQDSPLNTQLLLRKCE